MLLGERGEITPERLNIRHKNEGNTWDLFESLLGHTSYTFEYGLIIRSY